ncbi:Heat shock protein 70 family [Penicillium brevicompactum]|uniref:Heat shock protein 70 family n=1 Tax=Penicillium brevicompactum TaxID=5074 RepID=UPI00253FD72A|nr:Heat shock protein 70 family [Penicillium brevicompactum]KAJ5325285.1 Heat shock protein 70 family [Penicillium brevicompactum]
MGKPKKTSLERRMSKITVVDDRARLIVGLDFGTTWSRVAFGMENCPGDIEVIQTWPGGSNRTTEKVPTLISYRGTKLAWGYQIDYTEEGSKTTIQGLKLLLDESQAYRFEPARESKLLIEELGKTPVGVAGDYLEHVVAFSMEILKRRFSTALKAMEIHYFLTVPAVWSDKAKDLTLRAARLARVPATALTLLSEPEAAAVYAIQTMQPNSIKKNDCLIVCDAGGGTVDIITYQITQTEPLRFAEATEGAGGVCGSIMLDEQFEALLRRIYRDDFDKEIPQHALRAAKQYWQDYIKPTYKGVLHGEELKETPYQVPLPGLTDLPRAKDFDHGIWFMEHDQVKGIFDPIVEEIEDLIGDQLLRLKQKTLLPKAMLLVGGLGSSEYLFRQLRASFDGIEVMQPKNPWSAVVRGAVLRGQEGNRVDNRVARCNYGIKHWSRRAKPSLKTRWCPYEEKRYRTDCMTWYITKVRTEIPVIYDLGKSAGCEITCSLRA